MKNRSRFCLLSDGSTVSLKKGEKYKAFEKQLAAKGMQCLKTREVKQRSVTQYIVTGKEAGNNKWAGKYIPIFPVVGEEYYVEGERKRRPDSGCQRRARMYNYWRSASTEQVALKAPKSAYIAADDAIAGYGGGWSNANVKNQAYLRYKSGWGTANTRSGCRSLRPAMIAELQGPRPVFDDWHLPCQPRAERPGDIRQGHSRASERRRCIDLPFQDNLTRAIRFAGRVLVDLIPRISRHRACYSCAEF